MSKAKDYHSRDKLLISIFALGLMTGFPPFWLQAGEIMKPVRVSEKHIRPTRQPDGTLITFFSKKGEGESQDLYSRTSSDGINWSELQLIGKIDKRVSVGVPLVTQDGEIHFFWGARREGVRSLDVWYCRSIDGRKKWMEPKCIFKGYGAGGPKRPIQLNTGRILFPLDYRLLEGTKWRTSWVEPGEGFDDFTYHGPFINASLYSDDQGKTFRLGAALRSPVPDFGTYGANEPVALELKDGRIWMLMRTQMGRQYESFSDDGGIHWSTARPSRFISSDSPAELVRTHDGRIVIIWNNCLRFPYAYGGRHVLHAAISDDEGRTWRGFREVNRDPLRKSPPPERGDHGTGYSYAWETKDGNILLATRQDTRVMVMVNPQWLYETNQLDDFTNANNPEEILDKWSVFGTKGVGLVNHPQKAEAKVLQVRKAEEGWAATAVRNFPIGKKGRLRLKIMFQEGFGGANISLTDHFSPPFDPEAEVHSLYTLYVSPDGRLNGASGLESKKWHLVNFIWDFAQGTCRVFIDSMSKPTVVLRQLKMLSDGACYLRLRASQLDPLLKLPKDDTGLLVQFVDIAVE